LELLFEHQKARPGPALVGWLVATLFGLGFAVFGASLVYETIGTRSSSLTFFPIALLFTAPTLLVRAVVPFHAGALIAALVGACFGAFLFPVTHDLFQPVADTSKGQVSLAFAAYCFAGAVAGAVWWVTEKILR
jgi:hypothetical protein